MSKDRLNTYPANTDGTVITIWVELGPFCVYLPTEMTFCYRGNQQVSPAIEDS